MLFSCGSSGRTVEKNNISFKPDHVKVKQEPGTEDEVCSFVGAVKQEKTEDGRRSACMVKPCLSLLCYTILSSDSLSTKKTDFLSEMVNIPMVT